MLVSAAQSRTGPTFLRCGPVTTRVLQSIGCAAAAVAIWTANGLQSTVTGPWTIATLCATAISSYHESFTQSYIDAFEVHYDPHDLLCVHITLGATQRYFSLSSYFCCFRCLPPVKGIVPLQPSLRGLPECSYLSLYGSKQRGLRGVTCILRGNEFIICSIECSFSLSIYQFSYI